MYITMIDIGLLDHLPWIYYKKIHDLSEVNLLERKKSEILSEIGENFGQIFIDFVKL